MSSFRYLLPLVAALCFCVPSARSQYIQAVWQTVALGDALGLSNIHVVDVDGDGQDEIVMGGGGWPNRHFVVLEGTANSYDVGWISEPYHDWSINQIAVASTGASALVAVALHNGDVEIYDGATMTLADTLITHVYEVSALRVDDVDLDGNLELLIGSNHLFRIFDLETHDMEFESSIYAATEFTIGNVDGDDQPEVIFNAGIVLDGATRSVDWHYAGGFGTEVETADVDDDGVAEILASDGYRIVAYDAEAKSPLWEFLSPEIVEEFRVLDLDGDGTPELLIGEPYGFLRCYSLSTHETLWSMESGEYGMTNIALGDPDGDGVTEVIWGSGQAVIADLSRRRIEWKSRAVAGPYYVRANDIDGDRVPDIIGTSVHAGYGYGQGELFVLDGRSHSTMWRIQPGDTYEIVEALSTADVNGDEVPEVIVGHGGSVAAYDGKTQEQLWNAEASGYITAIEAADIDHDGDVEVVVGDAAGYITVLNGATGEQEWKSVHTGDRIGSVTLANCDDDANLEIVFFNVQGHIHVYDGVDHLLEWQSVDIDHITSVAVADIDGDGTNEIVSGHFYGTLTVFDGDDFSEVTTTTVGETAIVGLAVANLDASSEPELILGSETLRVLRLSDFEPLWESRILARDTRDYYVAPLVGAGKSIVAADVDSDGLMDVLAGGPSGLYHFEATQPYPDTSPPFVTHYSPPSALASVGLDARVTVKFSEPIDAASLDGRATISNGSGDEILSIFSWRESDSTLVLAANPALPAQTEIRVRLTGNITDLAGNRLDGNGNGVAEGSPADDLSWTFTSGSDADTFAPIIRHVAVHDTVWLGATMDITLVLSDTSSIASGTLSDAEAHLDESSTPISIRPIDGAFDDPVDTARVQISTLGLAEGSHTVFVRARDALGTWSPYHEIPFVLRGQDGSSWVMYGYDAQHTGANAADSIRLPLVKTWHSFESMYVRGAITVGDVVVFTSQRAADGEAMVSAHDVRTGLVKWERSMGPGEITLPAYEFGRVYIQMSDSQGKNAVSALDLQTGTVLWRSQYESYSLLGDGPTVHGRRVFTNGGTYGGIHAHDAITGSELWSVNLEFYDMWTPSALEDTVYGFIGGRVTAVDGETGFVAWTLDVGDESTKWGLRSTPIIDKEHRRMFLVSPYFLHAVDLNTREVIWEKADTHPYAGAYHDGTLYVIENSQLVAYEAGTGRQKWAFPGNGDLMAGPIIAGDKLFVGSSTVTYALDLESRQVEWQVDYGAWTQSGLIAGSERLLVVGNGVAHVFESSDSHVASEDPQQPLGFALHQNYPNPFNPSTQITYLVGSPSNVVVEVYNMIGQRVAMLVDGHHAAGEHKVTWDAAGYSSGIYVYRMRSDHHTETRQMVLLR